MTVEAITFCVGAALESVYGLRNAYHEAAVSPASSDEGRCVFHQSRARASVHVCQGRHCRVARRSRATSVEVHDPWRGMKAPAHPALGESAVSSRGWGLWRRMRMREQ